MTLHPRGSKSIFHWLPNEIITQIIQATPRRADRRALCRTSKLFHALAAPVLYRAVDICTFAELETFCSAVLSNPALAELVRSFTAVFNPDEYSYDIWLPRQLVDATKALVHLEALSIPIGLVPDENLRELLRWTFPHLVRCSLGSKAARWSSTEQDDTLASFLLRHRALKTLHVQDWDPLETWLSGSARIPLLHLEHLRCPGGVLPAIVTSSLKEARIYWVEYEPNDAEGTFHALKSMVRTDVPFVCSNDACDGSFSAIVDSLSRNIPHTKTLHLQMYNLYADCNRSKMDDLKKYLSRFTGLAFLWIESTLGSDAWGDGPMTVGDFSDACPSLEACCIELLAWRKMNGTWDVFPPEDFKALCGIFLR
ncbi:hypothetical protein FB451DRAFT_1221228 [Mycena latifolia]|nr:hypothetical protein FB451DRAFT_1221228 [Mycena latifolia]